MAASFNQLTLLGNLTRDPEIRYLSSGDGVCKFSLAVNEKYGEKEHTLFIDAVAWGKLGEICNQYLTKGSQVLVVGRLAIRKYDNAAGEKRTSVEIVVSTMKMLGSKRGDRGGATSGSGAEEPYVAPGEIDDSEIPF